MQNKKSWMFIAAGICGVGSAAYYYFACFICAECTFFHPTSKGLLGNTKLFSQHFLGVASLYHVGFE